jgi:Ni/Co efflux regulator RcnB
MTIAKELRMRTSLLPARWLAFIVAGLLAGAPALAEKPDHAGGGKHGNKHEKAEKHGKGEKHGKAEKHGKNNDGPRAGAYFDDRHRASVRKYYTSYSGKSCPPGLAKKNNGCMPPGQAKKWNVGHPLPSTVTVYAVPQQILISLPPPPPAHKYVRVAGDILLIAVGTSMVVDGINGLMN